MGALPTRDNVWKLAEAKNKLSELVNRTIRDGRQEIHRRDDIVVVISKRELDAIEQHAPSTNLKDHLLSIPRDVPGEPSLTELILAGRKGEVDH